MELLSPPVIQMIAGCLLESFGSGVRYAASGPTADGYATFRNTEAGGVGGLDEPAEYVICVLNARRASARDVEFVFDVHAEHRTRVSNTIVLEKVCFIVSLRENLLVVVVYGAKVAPLGGHLTNSVYLSRYHARTNRQISHVFRLRQHFGYR